MCQIFINVDSSTLGSLLGLNTHFTFLMCVVYVLYYICNVVCYLNDVCYFVLCVIRMMCYFVLCLI